MRLGPPRLLGVDLPLPEDLFPEISGRFEPDAGGHPRGVVMVRLGDGPEERFIVSPFHGICEIVRDGILQELCNVCFAPFAAERGRGARIRLLGSACLRVEGVDPTADRVAKVLRSLAIWEPDLDRPGRWSHLVAGSKARFVKGPAAGAKMKRALIGFLKANAAFLWSPQVNAATRRAR